MNLISHFGNIFQLSYVTQNRDQAVLYASTKLGIAKGRVPEPHK